MRTIKQAAGGGPLAALFLLIVVALSLSAIAGERIRVEQALSWTVHEQGVTGLPERVDLTLLLSGLGPLDGFPIDCILIIDTSATADLSAAKAFAFDLIDRFDTDDRIGLVSYATNARVDIPLTGNRLALKTEIAELSRDGRSALGDALQVARRELTATGRQDAILVKILLSDGQHNVGVEPGLEGKIASELGIRVISVGIGTLINRTLMQTLAVDTGGLFFARPTGTTVADIMDHLDIDTVVSNVRIEKQLPSGLRLISSAPSAYRVETDAAGITTAAWRVSSLLIDQQLEITLQIEATEIGAWANDLDLLVTYTDFRGVESSETFPPPNWPPVAMFEYSPFAPTTADIISFTDKSDDTEVGGRIVSWEWEFGDEAVSRLQHPEFRFAERGVYMVQLTVTDDRGLTSIAYQQEITVGNSPPIAGFIIRDPETLTELIQPHLGVPVMLDASMAYDLDGIIDLYKWDIDGDGIIDLETTSSDIEHAFQEPGEIKLTLTIVDDEGRTDVHTETVDILPSVLAVRSVETCMPNDVTIPARVVQVSIVISVNTLLHGLSVSETVPVGWTFAEVDSDGATLRQNGQTMEWLFLEKFLDDGINVKREIKYTLTSPATITDEPVQAHISGIVGSSSPRVMLTISGDDRITIVETLPVPVIISRWNTEEGKFDPCLQGLIAFDQIQYAVSLWLSREQVPLSGGATIDLAMMQDLIAYWLSGRSVHDPLL